MTSLAAEPRLDEPTRTPRARSITLWAVSAMLSAFAVLSALAPFIANDRPIWYRGVNQFEYRDAHRTLVALLERRARGEPSLPGAIARQVERMHRQLGTVAAHDLANLVLDAADQQSLQNIRTDYALGRVQLMPHTYWPVLESLTTGDRLAVIVIVTGSLWLGALLLRAGRVRRRLQSAIAIIGSLAALAACAGRRSSIHDRTDYRAGISAPESERESASVKYDSALWPPVPYRFDDIHLDQTYVAPRATIHWLGTDELGRDLLARLVWGGRVTLAVGLLGVLAAIVIGVPIGAFAGYRGGRTDLLASRLLELVECFPGILLILTVVTFFQPGFVTIVLAIGLTSWPTIARLTRAEFLRIRQLDFVTAAETLGSSSLRIMARHVLPNALAPLIVAATFGVASAMLTESAISFLGFGVTIPTPSWGGILAGGRTAATRAPWLLICPGLAIAGTVILAHFLGELFRSRLVPTKRE